MNDSFVFYRSFAEGLKEVDDSTYRRLMEAITWYALDGTVPELSGLEKSLFLAWKANVDANTKRQLDGRKGGAPIGNNNASKQPKQPKTTMVESETTMVEEKQPNENENGNANANVNENANVKGKPAPQKHKYGRYGHVLLTDQELECLVADNGEALTYRAIDWFDEYIERKGYSAKSHYLCFGRWVFKAMQEEEIKQQELTQREQRLQGKPPDKPRHGQTSGTNYDTMMEGIANETLNRYFGSP